MIINEALLSIKKGDVITGGKSGKSYKVLDTDDGQGNVVVLDLEGKGKTYLNKSGITTKEFYKESIDKLAEDTEKKANGKWVNKGKEGEHGEFDTKSEADAQRRAMFANGFS